MIKKTIGLDMDNVIVDSFKAFMDVLKKDFPRPDRTDEDWEKLFAFGNGSQADLDLFFEIVSREGFFRNLPWMDADCHDVIAGLHKQYDVYIVTAAMNYPPCVVEKIDWLQENLPMISPSHYVFCGKKGIIYTDYLLDDNIDKHKGFRGTGLCYHTKVNQHREISEPRLHSWQEVGAYFGL